MEAATVRHVSGSSLPERSCVRLRMETHERDRSQDFLISIADIEPLVTLLLVLGGKAGAVPKLDAPLMERRAFPLPVDSLAVGETDDGETVIELYIGQTALAFALPGTATRQLGQSLLTLGASTATGSA